jgi:hypothetical protein
MKFTLFHTRSGSLNDLDMMGLLHNLIFSEKNNPMPVDIGLDMILYKLTSCASSFFISSGNELLISG